jgi:carbamoyl-phosphate synthase large subunit
VCRKFDVQGIISLFDPDVYKLSANRSAFIGANIVPVFPELRAVTIAHDKFETSRFLSSIGIPTPLTASTLEEAECFLKTGAFCFPLIVKPRFGFGCQNTFLSHNKTQLKAFASYAPDMVVQQFIDGDEINIDGLGDMMCRPLAIVPWRKLRSRGGETDYAVTIDCPELMELGKRLIREIGIIGPFDCDFIRGGDGVISVLDINLRFAGGYPVSHLAGANFPEMITQMILGLEPKGRMDKYERGIAMIKDIRIKKLENNKLENLH